MSQDQSLPDGRDALLLHVAQSALSDESPGKLAVAVSGGGDSMAALHLFARAAAQSGHTLLAVTVNHQLRPEAAGETALVARACAALGVPHQSLTWDHGKIEGNLQDRARRARYGLIADWARANDVTHVVLGHTADDQAETVLMRLAREAGVDGLSGMREHWTDRGVTFLRPFMFASRAGLRAYLRRNGIAWADDPSNDDEGYARIRARKVLAALEPLDITADTLCAVASNLHWASAALQEKTLEAARSLARTDAGDLIFERTAFALQPLEIQRRLMIGAILWISGDGYVPRREALFDLELRLLAEGAAQLRGCQIAQDRTTLRFGREWNAVRDCRSAPGTLWDGRWQLMGPVNGECEIAALGAEGLRDCPDWRETGRPRASLIASPAIWRGDTLVSAPIAGYPNGWTAKLVPDRADFAASLIRR